MMYRVVSLLLILFVMYSVLKIKNGGKDPFFSSDDEKSSALEGGKPPEYLPEETTPVLQGSFLEKTISNVMINVLKTEKGRILIERMIQPASTPLVDKDYSLKANNFNIIDSVFRVKTTNEGSGDKKTICGHTVDITYKVINMQDMVIEKGRKPIVIGQSSIFKAMDNVIIGMKLGESRTAIIPESFAYESQDFTGKKPINATKEYKIEVTLNSIISDFFIDDKVKVFDDEISFKTPALCSDRVAFDVKIMNLSGDIVENRKNLNFKLGDLAYPVIFSYGLFNKQDKGVRTVISRGRYLQNFSHEYNKLIFPDYSPKDDQFYILEFSNIVINPSVQQSL